MLEVRARCLCSFAVYKCMGQGGNEGDKETTITRGQNHHGGVESLHGAPKRFNNVVSTFFKYNTVHMIPKDLRLDHGGANLLTVPGAIQPCSVSGMGPKIEVQETIHKDFNFCAPPQSGALGAMPAIP